MKKLSILVLALVYASVMSAQTITSVNPNSGTQGNVGLAVQISGSGTSFNQGTATYVYFSQGTATYYIDGYNTVVNNSTSITTYLDLPFSTTTGVYDLYLSDGTNSYSLPSAFTVLAGPVPQISYVDTNYASQGTTLDVVISGTNTNFQSGSSTVWFSQGSSTIYPNSVNVTSATSLTANITVTSADPFGFYDVNVSDYIDNTITLPYGFFVSDSTVGIVSVTGDTTTYSFGDSVTVIITGSGTHFAQAGDTTTVWLGQVHRSEVPNIFPVRTHVISNTQISATFYFPANVPAGRYDIFTYNNTDGELTKQWAISLATGINNTEADKLKVYPNPVNGKLFIESTGQMDISEISLTSLNGQVILKRAATNAKQEILDTQNIASGVYILSITDQTGATSYRKVMVD